MNGTPLAPEPTSTGPDMELEHRRAAIAALGHELRTLVDATVRTEAAPDTLHGVAAGVRGLVARLTGRRRTRAEIPDVDEFPGGTRMNSPVTGTGSPVAPPLRVTPSDDDGVVGRCVLGIAHEGPPGYGHGGFSAMLLDELMGWACAAEGTPAMTVSLQLGYRGPVPLETPLLVRAGVTARENRTLHVTGSIATEADPTRPLVTGEAVFVTPNPDHARNLFPGM
ncbi:PaaI family thioesterase [Streptomyces graminofaciens]|jgi:acyl-coenzyme A thioesterase PaaI-like protein|nr:PaaI family thioesterase [Streptomyces graminofaciens]